MDRIGKLLPLDQIEWGPSMILNHTVLRINNSKLIMENDCLFLKHAQKSNKGVEETEKIYWLVPACCAATIGAAASLTNKSMWPAIVASLPAIYGFCQHVIATQQKASVDKVLNLLCLTQTALFGTLECICNNITIDLMGDTRVLRVPPSTADINRILDCICSLITDLNSSLNMNQPIPRDVATFAGIQFTMDDINDARAVYASLRELNGYYSEMVSKLLLSFQLTLTVEQYDPTNTEKFFIICKWVPYLINLIEERAFMIVRSFRNLQFATNHPLNCKMICLQETIEWYNEHIDTLCTICMTDKETVDRTVRPNLSMMDVIKDLANIRKTLGKHITDMTESQKELRLDFQETGKALQRKALKEKELKAQAKLQIKNLIAEIKETTSKLDSNTLRIKNARITSEEFKKGPVIHKTVSPDNSGASTSINFGKKFSIEDIRSNFASVETHVAPARGVVLPSCIKSNPDITSHAKLDADSLAFTKTPAQYKMKLPPLQCPFEGCESKHIMPVLIEDKESATTIDNSTAVRKTSQTTSKSSTSGEWVDTFSITDDKGSDDTSYATISTASSSDKNYGIKSPRKAKLQKQRAQVYVLPKNVPKQQTVHSNSQRRVSQIPTQPLSASARKKSESSRVDTTTLQVKQYPLSVEKKEIVRSVNSENQSSISLETEQFETSSPREDAHFGRNIQEQDIIRINFIKHAKTLAHLRHEEEFYFKR